MKLKTIIQIAKNRQSNAFEINEDATISIGYPKGYKTFAGMYSGKDFKLAIGKYKIEDGKVFKEQHEAIRNQVDDNIPPYDPWASALGEVKKEKRIKNKINNLLSKSDIDSLLNGYSNKPDIYDVQEQDMICLVSNSPQDKYVPRFYNKEQHFFPHGQKSIHNPSEDSYWKYVKVPTPEQAPLFERIPYHTSWGKPRGINGMRVLLGLREGSTNLIDGQFVDWKEEGRGEILWYMIVRK